MHPHVHRLERQTYGRGGSDDDGAGKDRQVRMHVRQRRGRTGNADRVVARVAGFNPEGFPSAVVAMQIVIVVIILGGDCRRAVVMVVTVMAVTV